MGWEGGTRKKMVGIGIWKMDGPNCMIRLYPQSVRYHGSPLEDREGAVRWVLVDFGGVYAERTFS